MNILYIAYYTVLRNFRDKKSMAMTLLFPIVLIMILGSALSQEFKPDKIGKTSVAYLNEDKGVMSEQFNRFLENNSIKEMLDIKKVNSYKEGIKLVEDNKVTSLIYINSEFTKAAEMGKKPVIKVVQSRYQYGDFKVSIVQNIVDSFINGANTIEAVNKMGIGARSYNVYENIKDIPIPGSGKMPRAIDYYAVTMLVMTLMYGTLFGSYGVSEDYREKTYIRIKGAPIRAYVSFLGRTLGAIFTMILEALIIIFFTKYAFKTNWGSNIPLILGMVSLFSIMTTGLGVMAYTITKSDARASGILSVLVVVTTFLSGGYAKINTVGTPFEKFTYLSPNKIIQTAIFNTIYGGSASQTQGCIIAIVIIIVITFLIASIAGRRELA